MTPAQSSRVEKLIKDMWAELEASKSKEALKRCVVRPHSNVPFVPELRTAQKTEAGK